MQLKHQKAERYKYIIVNIIFQFNNGRFNGYDDVGENFATAVSDKIKEILYAKAAEKIDAANQQLVHLCFEMKLPMNLMKLSMKLK